MRSYEEIAERIMARGDKINEERRVRAVKIKQTSYAVSGMCAAVIAGIGLWRVTSGKDVSSSNFPDSGIISDNNTHTSAVPTATDASVQTAASTAKTTKQVQTTASGERSSASTAKNVSTTRTSRQTDAVTEKAQETQVNTSAVMRTESAARTTVPATNAARTTVPATNAVRTTVPTTNAAGTQTAEAVRTTVPETTQTTAKKTIPTAQTQSPVPSQTSPEVQTRVPVEATVIVTREASVFDPVLDNYRIISFSFLHNENTSVPTSTTSSEYKCTYYSAESNNAKIGGFLGSIHVRSVENEGVETDASLYRVMEIDPSVMIAVTYSDSNNFYFYYRNDYRPDTLDMLMNHLSVDAGQLLSDVRVFPEDYEVTDREALWDIIMEDPYIPDITDDEKYQKSIFIPKAEINFFPKGTTNEGGTIKISGRGYMRLTYHMVNRAFYIGEERAERILAYIRENYEPK